MLTQVTKTEQTIEQLINAVECRGSGRFSKIDTRKAVVNGLKAKGYTVRVETSRGCRLHPEYVTDFVGVYETGFGNSDYETHWKAMYNVEITGYPNE